MPFDAGSRQGTRELRLLSIPYIGISHHPRGVKDFWITVANISIQNSSLAKVTERSG